MENRSKSVNKPMRGRGKGFASKTGYTYGTDMYDHVAGKHYNYDIHEQPCWILYTGTNLLRDRLIKAFNCALQYVEVPETTENRIIALWRALYGDKDYFKKSNAMYSGIKFQG
eukprot:15365251-Ditylum_brightwellii.AAC.3